MPVEMNQNNETSEVSTDNNKKDLIPKSFLQTGNDLRITSTIFLKHPTIQEIFDIDKDRFGLNSEKIYYSYVNLFLTDPYDYMVFLDDNGVDYEKSSSFEVFCMLFEDYNNKFKQSFSLDNIEFSEEDINIIKNMHSYFQAFKFFFSVDDVFLSLDENNEKVLAYGDNQFLLNQIGFEYVEEFMRGINGIPRTDRINPSDEWAKQILIEDKRDEEKRKKKKKDTDEEKDINRLGNMLSAITWICGGNITPFNRNQLHIYDLIDGIYRTNKLKNYENTMTGFYSGCIEKNKINFNELHWSTD